MSKGNKTEKNVKYNAEHSKVVHLAPVIAPPTRNVGISTFSNMAKQAESLVHGDNSLVFNTYLGNIIFRSNKLDLKDCLNVNFANKTLENVNAIHLKNGIIEGISDGYTNNNQGIVFRLSDKKIALSTVFGSEMLQKSDQMNKEFNLEVERRKYDDNVLLSKLQETSEHCEMVLRMVHYIHFDTENHSFSVNIPFEDASSTYTSFVDLMPSETVEQSQINKYPDEGLTELQPVNSSSVEVLNIDRYGIKINGQIIFNNHTYNKISTSLDAALHTSIPTTKAVSDELFKQVNILSNNISKNASDIASNANKIASNTTNIASNANKIASNTTNIASNTANIASNSSEITNLQNIIRTLESRIQALEEQIQK